MSQLNLIPPSPKFQKPDGFKISEYTNQDGYNIRYGYLKSQNEHAVLILLGGQTQFIEMDFESAKDLTDIGISFYTVERVGDGGSERLYADPQKPPAVSHDIYVRDLHQFLSSIIDLPDDKPVLLAGQCLGGLVALKYVGAYPGVIDHCIPTAPLFGLRLQGANSLCKRFDWAIKDITPENRDRYIGKARDWSWELAEKLIANDLTSHDQERASLHHHWRRINHTLQE
jgi:alpha-beta hydrolase superfamily lysophospholipase